MMPLRARRLAPPCRPALVAAFVLAILCSLLARPALAVDPAFSWSRNYGLAAANAYGFKTASDSAGNIYVVGQYDGATLAFDGQTVTRLGANDGFIVKVDPSGTVQWAQTLGGAGATTRPQGVAVDGAGNVLVAGYFNSGNLAAAAGNLTRTGTQDGFLIKYDTNGTRLWSFGVGNSSVTAQFFAVATDSTNNVYVTGNFSGGNIPAISSSRTGNQDGFLLKVDSSGTLQSPTVKIAGASISGSLPTSLAVSGTNIYVGGYMTNPNGGLTSPAALADMGGGTTAYMLRFDATLAVTWRQAIGGSVSSNARGNAIAADASGNVYLTGTFVDSLTTPSLARIATGSNKTAFVVKATPTGATTTTFAWTNALGGSTADADLQGLAVDAAGDAYVSGQFAQSLTTPPLTGIGSRAAMVLKYAAADGTLSWSKAFGGPGGTTNLAGNGITIAAGNIVLAGNQEGTATDPAQAAIGAIDVLLIKYSQTHTLTVTKAGTSTGTVTADSGALSCGLTCSADYTGGTVVTLTAAATSGATFAGWSGDCSGAAASTSVTMSAARSCTATFNTTPTPGPTPTNPTPAAPTVQLPINTSGSGQGSVSLSAALGNPGPNATYTVQQTSGAALPSWLSFNPATVSFSYNVPMPADLPIQPAAADTRAARPAPPNLVYPLSILVQAIPVSLTVNGQAYVINMDFYAPRGTVAATALSYSAGGRSGDGASGKPAMSWDGGQVLFETSANNLFSAFSTETKIARYHGLSGNRDLLSQTAVPGGGVANASIGPATAPAVSANGTFGVFAGAGGGITLTPASPLKQIYRTSLAYPRVALNEAATPAPLMVSTSATGVPANAAADRPAISQDGNFVAFESAATNLGWNQGGSQIWRKTMTDGSVTLVSGNAQGTAGNGDSRNVSLSWDGRVAVFDSTATNLVAGATGRQVYFKDLASGAVYVIAPGIGPKLDARAGSIVFTDQGSIRRFDVATGRTATLATGDADQPTVSADGRFVAWRAPGADGFTQVWVRDVFRGITALASQTASGTPGGGNSYDPALSGDGASLAFGSQARDLVNGNPLSGQIHLAGNPLALPGRTLHWYVPSGGNQAWAIERWGDRAYVANLAYQANGGTATWVAGSCGFADLGCKGTLNPTAAALATWFPVEGNQAVASVNGGANIPLLPYPVMGTSTSAMPGLPQGGWWYEPASIGSGVFLQFGTQTTANGTIGHTAHLSLLSYDAQGMPVWYAAEGMLGTDLSLEGVLYRYAGGAPVGSMTGGAVPSATAVGNFRLTFAASDNASLRLPDGSNRALARFRF